MQSPENAKHWLERVLDAVDSLEHLPRRGAKAQEDEFVAYEVRQLVVGSHLLLFSIDDEQRKVWLWAFDMAIGSAPSGSSAGFSVSRRRNRTVVAVQPAFPVRPGRYPAARREGAR